MGSLEDALVISKKKLKQEGKLRRQMGENLVALNEENQILRGEVVKNAEEAETFSSGTKGISTVDDSYAEVLDELESVTEQLISTQQKLWKTEDMLKKSKTLVGTIEEETEDSETIGGEKQLLDELSLMKDELAAAHAELKAAEEQAVTYQKRLSSIGDESQPGLFASQETMIQELKQEVQESRKENTDLVEQIACLRQTLVDQIQPEELESSRNIQRKQWASEMREEIAENIRSAILSETQEEREMESNLLREKFKKVFKENASLQRRIDELENEAASVLSKNDASKYKDEISQLSMALKTAQEQHKSVISETEASWSKELEKVQAEPDPIDESKKEIYELKTQVAKLTYELESSQKGQAFLDSYNLRLQDQYAEVKAELEVSHQIIEDAGLVDEVMKREDTVKLKQQVNTLTLTLEKLKKDYSTLMEESEGSKRKISESITALKVVDLGKSAASIEGEKRGREAALKELSEERKLFTSKLDILAGEKKVLEKRLEMSEASAAAIQEELDEAKAANSPLGKRLGEFQSILLSSRIEAMDLKEQVLNLESEGIIVQYNDDRAAWDSETGNDGDEGVEVIKPVQLNSSKKDPPTGASLSSIGVLPIEEDDVEKLRTRLLDLSLENAGLKADLEATQKLGFTQEEIFRLKDEMSGLETDLSDTRLLHKTLLKELEKARENAESNIGLQQTVTELEESLTLAQKKIEKKGKEMQSLEKTLVSTQEETQLLTEEISHLSSAFENTKSEYDAVVEELDAVNELFEEARDEAERCGREAAAEEVRAEMHAAREKERKVMKEQLKKVFEENASLQRMVGETEKLLAEAQDAKKLSVEHATMIKEVEILKEALKASAEEIKTMKEKEFNLTMDLKAKKNDLRELKDDLEVTTYCLDEVRQEAEKNAMKNIVEENEEQQALRDHLQKVIKDSEGLDTSSIDDGWVKKEEGLRLKVELLDMSMSLEKVMKENAAIETELREMNKRVEEARASGEKLGRLAAATEVRKEMRSELEKEMKESKEQFSALMEENTNLQQKFKEAEISLALLKDSQQTGKDQLTSLENELIAAKVETRKFQEEVFNLTVELETNNADHESILEDLQSSINSDRTAKFNALKRQLSALSIENATLQHKLRKARTLLAKTEDSEAQSGTKLERLNLSLTRSYETVGALEVEVAALRTEVNRLEDDKGLLSEERTRAEKQLKEAESALLLAKSSDRVKDADMEALNLALCASKDETSELRVKVSQLSEALEEGAKELGELQETFDEACDAAERRGWEAGILAMMREKIVDTASIGSEGVQKVKSSVRGTANYIVDTASSSVRGTANYVVDTASVGSQKVKSSVRGTANYIVDTASVGSEKVVSSIYDGAKYVISPFRGTEAKKKRVSFPDMESETTESQATTSEQVSSLSASESRDEASESQAESFNSEGGGVSSIAREASVTETGEMNGTGRKVSAPTSPSKKSPMQRQTLMDAQARESSELIEI